MKNKRLLLLFLLISIFSFGQDESLISKKEIEKNPLKQVLKSLQEEFEVRFSFDSKLIDNFSVSQFDGQEDLNEKLKFLEKETNLNFQQIDKRYIIVKKKEIATDHSVCGFLIDKNSKTPLSNATIWVENTSIGVSSDSQGYFELNSLHSDWQIRIDYLGYQSIKIEVFRLPQKECQNIYLIEDNQQLEEVLISDYLTKGLSKKRDGAIRVSPEKLGILPGLTEPDVLQSLQLLPGVQSPGETASDLHVRGGTPDQNLVLFDGIKMYDSGHFFGLISSFNPYVTESVDFYRSGSSAKYGDRIGGVLDISSGTNIPKFHAGFGLNLLHADAYVKAPLLDGKVGLIISGRRSLTDIWNTITYQKFSESVFQNTRIVLDETVGASDISTVENNFFFNDYNIKLIADVTKNDKVIFSNLYNNNDLEYYSENDRFNEKSTDNLSTRNLGSNLKWIKKWSDTWSHKVELDHSDYQLNNYSSREIIRRDPNKSRVITFEKLNKVSDLGMKLDFINCSNEISTWSHGYQFSKNHVEYLFERTGDTNNGNQSLPSEETMNTTHAVFSEYSLRKNQKWNMNIGVRLNYFSVVDKLYFEPRFFISNQLSKTWQLKFSAEIKNQVLSQLIEFRNDGLGLENDIWALSNKTTIPVLHNTQVTAGVLFQKNGWNLDVDLYNKVINGLTILTEDVATRVPQYLSGVSVTNGVDFLLKKRFRNYRTWISYTLSKTKFEYDRINNGTEFDGTYDIPHSLVWSHTYILNKLEFSLGWKIRSGTPYTKGIGIQRSPNGNYRILYEDEVNTNRLPTYKKVDLSATYKFAFSKSGNVKGKFGVSLMNLFDTVNILDRSYEIKNERNPPGEPDSRRLIETDQLSIGFTPNLVFRVDF